MRLLFRTPDSGDSSDQPGAALGFASICLGLASAQSAGLRRAVSRFYRFGREAELFRQGIKRDTNPTLWFQRCSCCAACGGRCAALQEEDFGPVLGAGGFLIATGTVTYSLGNGWNIIDAFYFAMATLTTSSIADPDLVLEDRWLKIFTVFYILIGIGILVEIARRFGMAFIEVRRQDKSRGDAATTGG